MDAFARDAFCTMFQCLHCGDWISSYRQHHKFGDKSNCQPTFTPTYTLRIPRKQNVTRKLATDDDDDDDDNKQNGTRKQAATADVDVEDCDDDDDQNGTRKRAAVDVEDCNDNNKQNNGTSKCADEDPGD